MRINSENRRLRFGESYRLELWTVVECTSIDRHESCSERDRCKCRIVVERIHADNLKRIGQSQRLKGDALRKGVTADCHDICAELHRLEAAAVAERARVSVIVGIIRARTAVAAADGHETTAELDALQRRAAIKCALIGAVAGAFDRLQRIGEHDRLQSRAVRKRAIADRRHRIGDCQACNRQPLK